MPLVRSAIMQSGAVPTVSSGAMPDKLAPAMGPVDASYTGILPEPAIAPHVRKIALIIGGGLAATVVLKMLLR